MATHEHQHAHGHDHAHAHRQPYGGEQAQNALADGHFTRDRQQRDLSHIQGWGADRDPKDRPGYPMERTPPRLDNVHWDQPEQQPVNVPVLHSTERPGMTPVFGSTVPLRGLSGWFRRMAFRFSENDIRHWLILLFADRVNVVEGIGEDLMHGHVPNILGEMGIRAEMKHNPAGLAKKAVVAGAVVGVAWYLMSSRRRTS